MNFRKFTILTFFLFFVISCGTRDIIPAAPDETSYAPPPPATASAINIPIKIDLTELGKTLNAKVPNELYADLKGTDIGYGSKIGLRIVRNGKIYMTTKDAKVTTNIPIKIIDGKLTTTALGLSHSEPFGATMFIQMNTVIAADKKWNFTSNTSSDFGWGQEPTLKVAGVSIPLGKVTYSTVKAQLAKIAPLIDQQIKDLVSLRPTMEGVWNGLNEPRLMTDSPAPVWMVIKPTDFAVSPPTSSAENLISFNIGIKTFVETSVGSKPMKQNLGVLPDLQIKPFNDNHFAMSIPAVLRYDDMKTVIKQYVMGQKYAVKDGIQLEVKDLDFFGRGDKVALLLDFVTYGKATKGKFYLVGRPMLDAATQTLYLEDLDFDIKSKNALLSSANFLLHKPLLKKIQEQARYPLTETLASARIYIQKTLDDYPISDNVFLKGKIEDLHLDNIYLGQEYMRAYIAASGTMEGGFRHK
jgi:hypothetical protein